MPMVPWPAITSGSSNGWTNVSPVRACSSTACTVGVGVAVAVQDDLAAERPDGVDLQPAGW